MQSSTTTKNPAMRARSIALWFNRERLLAVPPETDPTIGNQAEQVPSRPALRMWLSPYFSVIPLPEGGCWSWSLQGLPRYPLYGIIALGVVCALGAAGALLHGIGAASEAWHPASGSGQPSAIGGAFALVLGTLFNVLFAFLTISLQALPWLGGLLVVKLLLCLLIVRGEPRRVASDPMREQFRDVGGPV